MLLSQWLRVSLSLQLYSLVDVVTGGSGEARHCSSLLVIARHRSSLLVIIFVRVRGVDFGEEMKLRGMYLRNARGLRR